MFHQVNYSEIVTIMLKPVGAVLENFENSQFFSQSQFSVCKEPDWDFRIKGFFVFCVYSSEKTISSVTTYGVQ